MRKHKKTRKIAALLASILVIESFIGTAAPYINTYAYTERSATVNASSLNVRSGPGTTYSIVTKLTNGASVTVVDEKSASDGATWYQIRFRNSSGQELSGYVLRNYIKFPVSYSNDTDFEAFLNAEGFPESYKTRLRELHARYPKWVFRAQKTNLDWETAVNEESKVAKNLVHTNSMSSWKSIEDGAFNWDTSTWVGYDGSSWVSASKDIVKYYMDPRNFLDETNIFQFLSHSYDSNSHTVEGLQTMVKGTFLSGSAPGGSSAPGTSNPSGSGSQGTGNNDSNYGPGVTGPASSGNSNGSSGVPGTEAPGGSGSGSGTIDSNAPSAGSNSNVSLEGPHASITPKNPQVLMEYGPGASLSGPPSSDPGTSGTSGTSGSISGSTNYAEIIMNAGTQSGVNPYVLAAMIIQEQGSNGTGRSVTGNVSGYEGYYNFFNIEAYQSGSMSAVERGLWWASQSGSYNRPWNSPDSSILGGALYYGTNYVKVGQDTFYLKKYNVQGSNLYKHQYMTNVQGAASEGAVYAKAYNDEMKQTALEFKIPVFNNMPDNACSQPTADGSPNNKLAQLYIDGFVMTPTYNRDTLEYNLIVNPSVSSVTVNASALDSTASIKGAGNIQLQSGANDVRIQVTAKNGTVREYIIHVVREENGPTYSSSVNGANPGNTGTNTGSNVGSNIGPGGTSAGPGDSGSGISSGGNGSGGASSGGISSGGPGAAGSGSGSGTGTGSGTNAGTPGGSNVTIVPN